MVASTTAVLPTRTPPDSCYPGSAPVRQRLTLELKSCHRQSPRSTLDSASFLHRALLEEHVLSKHRFASEKAQQGEIRKGGAAAPWAPAKSHHFSAVWEEQRCQSYKREGQGGHGEKKRHAGPPRATQSPLEKGCTTRLDQNPCGDQCRAQLGIASAAQASSSWDF